MTPTGRAACEGPDEATCIESARQRVAVHTVSLFGLCALLSGAGILHFIKPGPYRGIVPSPLRGHAALVVALSGVSELICAMLLAVPRTRRLGAFASAALFVAVFPANVQMAVDASRTHPPLSPYPVLTDLRLPLQIPLILWALSFRRRTPPTWRSSS